jgi:hypothetical protein
MSEPFKYHEINAAILNAIADGRTRAAGIEYHVNVAVKSWPAGRSHDRVIDGQLQKLKRDGKITFSKGNWALMPSAFDGRRFSVMRKRCDECLFSDAKIVSGERRSQILRSCARTGNHFLCHKGTLVNENIVCRGFYDEGLGHDRPNQALQIASRLGLVVFVEPGEQDGS